MAIETGPNYKDSSTAANIPVDAIIRTVAPTAVTAGQSARQVCAIGDGSDTGNFATVSAAGALQTWAFSSTAVLTQVAASATSVALLGVNAARKGAIITNTGTGILYVAYTGTASATAFSYQVGAGQSVTMTIPYQGAVSGIWTGTGGFAVITELT